MGEATIETNLLPALGPEKPESLPTQLMMRATMNAYVDRINAGDNDGVVNLFADDAIIEDPVGSQAKSGEAIVRWFAQTVAFATNIVPIAPIRGSYANAAALIFDVTFQPPGDGPRLLIRSLDVCTFNTAGQITRLSAYWGPDDVETAKADPRDAR